MKPIASFCSTTRICGQEFFIEGVNPGVPLIVELYELLRKHCSPETHDVAWSMEEMGGTYIDSRNAMQVGRQVQSACHAHHRQHTA